ncbi:MAG: HD domain-containing protein [Butyrivibrio sp.]|nr:HD domain-containing protein [Butyrivibrio sp.]
MKTDKSINFFLMFIAILMMLTTAYYVNRIALRNNVSLKVDEALSLTGARLTDKVYATVEKTKSNKVGKNEREEFEFNIINIGDNALNNWNVYLTIPKGAKIESSWNVEYSYYNDERDMVVLTPDYYYLSINPMEYVDFGVFMSTPVQYFPTEIRFVGYQLLGTYYTQINRTLGIIYLFWLIAFIGFLVTKFNLRSYREKQKNDVKLILQSMNTFISFIDAKDPYTRGHSKRVAMYAAEIAKRMQLSEDEIQNIYYAGLLHDAGKISVPDAVLNKPGKLSDEERALIQNHTVAGGKMLKQMSSIRGIRETALYHHERYDGNGYPEGLKGESIPLYARIVGVADSYDAMSSNRVYRRHLNKDDIIEEIQKGSGTQFDPDIVKYMVDMINDGYVNVVKMETADNDEHSSDFHITESDVPGVYMGY